MSNTSSLLDHISTSSHGKQKRKNIKLANNLKNTKAVPTESNIQKENHLHENIPKVLPFGSIKAVSKTQGARCHADCNWTHDQNTELREALNNAQGKVLLRKKKMLKAKKKKNNNNENLYYLNSEEHDTDTSEREEEKNPISVHDLVMVTVELTKTVKITKNTHKEKRLIENIKKEKIESIQTIEKTTTERRYVVKKKESREALNDTSNTQSQNSLKTKKTRNPKKKKNNNNNVETKKNRISVYDLAIATVQPIEIDIKNKKRPHENIQKDIPIESIQSVAKTPTERCLAGSNWEAGKKKVFSDEAPSSSSTVHIKKHNLQNVKVKQDNKDNNIYNLKNKLQKEGASKNKKLKNGKGAVVIPKLRDCVAMDCEMVGVGLTSRTDMLARVSIVDSNGNILLDKYVLPLEEVTDYRTFVSGIRPMDLENGDNYNDVQDEVIEILQGKLLIGHALRKDLQVLDIIHPHSQIRDTAEYKPLAHLVSHGRVPSLKLLSKTILGIDIQKGEHSSVEDARAAMSIYIKVRGEWETAFRNGLKK